MGNRQNNVFFISFSMMMFLSLQVSSSTDTISTNQPLSDLPDDFTEETYWSSGLNSTTARDTDMEAVLLDNDNVVQINGPASSATMFRESSEKFLPPLRRESSTKPELTNLLTTCPCPSTLTAYLYDDKICMIWENDYLYIALISSYYGEFVSRILLDGEMRPIYEENRGAIKYYKVITIMLASVLTSIAAAAFLVGSCCYFSSRHGRRAHKGEIEDDSQEEMCDLSLRTIITATNAFSEDCKLGEGGFGPVYKGKLPNGKDVAIKRLSKRSSQGLIEFKNEVSLVNKLQHRNLVSLLGYCVDEDEKLLIYEYISNKSLDALLFDPIKCRKLNWKNRMKIVNGTIRGLQYLHEDSRLKIIHRDLKASNILVDDEMNPKISDFGTARIFGCKQIDDRTERIVGTFGYMSPEYSSKGIISEKSDIYSFGVLLLEIISGKKANKFVHNGQKHNLIAYAWQSWCDTEGVNIIDEALGDSYSSKEVMRCIHIALLSVQDHPKDRPKISEIVNMLSNDHHLQHPKQPTFTNVLSCNQRLVSECVLSVNEATQTTMEGR